MSLDTVGGAGLPGAPGFGSQGVIEPEGFSVPPGTMVMEVNADGAVANPRGPEPGIYQSVTKFKIFTAPGHALVKTADRQRIAAPA